MASPPDDGLRAYLSGLSKEQLVDRLLALGERDDVALTALRAEKAAASGDLDLAAFRKELTARMRISGFVDWRGAAGYAQRVHGLLDVLEALLATGRTADVVVLAEHVMARLDTALGRIDDSNGHMGGVLDRVADIHLAACMAAEPSDGLEPSTPSLPSSNEAGTEVKRGKPRARKPRKKKESPEEE